MITINRAGNCEVTLRFFPDITLSDYQAFFDDCPVWIGVISQEFWDCGAFLTIEFQQSDRAKFEEYIEVLKDPNDYDYVEIADREPHEYFQDRRRREHD